MRAIVALGGIELILLLVYNGTIIAASGGLRTRVLKPIEEAGNGATVDAVCMAYVVLSLVSGAHAWSFFELVSLWASSNQSLN